MIDFELTDDHESIVQTVREFAAKEVAPHIKEWDERQQFDRAVLDKMGELNLLGVCLPEELGGAGFDYVALGLVCEELEYTDTFLRVAMSVHTGLNCLTLYSWGTEEQKRKYLVPQAKGEKLATYGLTEPGAGSDVVGSRSVARREGDEWVLNGEKMWISLADVADNFLFFCWTDEEKRKRRDHTGMSCFIVERTMPGFTSGTIHGKMGIRAGNTGYFSLQDVRVPQSNMVGQEGEGFKIAMFALEQGRYTVAAGATGIIRASRDASIKYANERETFGTKIANHQLVKQKIAEMEADYQMAHLLWLRAGWLKNEGLPNARATSLAKWQATTRSEKAASMAIEVHGANGYSNDYPVERFLRNCKAAIIYEGTRDIHTLMQADWALGLKAEKPARVRLPPYKPSESREAVAAD
ncbi:MAG TPA: acyl-CoA dehydrogenase family protein [Pyrinomonadaceae bacterium]|jgi:glutaryl-CoA dehydrogenase (non-decarboxylating)